MKRLVVVGNGMAGIACLEQVLKHQAQFKVTVFGDVGPAPDPLVDRVVEATGYRIEPVDGEPVLMGEIASVSGERATLRLQDGEEVILDVPPGVFRVGQKVWVKGPRRVGSAGWVSRWDRDGAP